MNPVKKKVGGNTHSIVRQISSQQISLGSCLIPGTGLLVHVKEPSVKAVLNQGPQDQPGQPVGDELKK